MKRFLVSLLALCLVAAMFPFTVFAADAVATVNGTEYSSLKDAMEAVVQMTSGTVTVELLSDVEIEDWDYFNINNVSSFVFDGNGHTITGLTKPLFYRISTPATISDLYIEGGDIVGGTENNEKAAVGAIIGWYENHSEATVTTIENCHVSDSEFKTSVDGNGFCGGIVGYLTGSDPTVRIDGCSVINCKLTGENSTGSVVGHNNAKTTITNTVIENNELTCTGDNGTRPDKVGIVIGRVNSGKLELNATVSDDNTLEPAGTNDQRVIGAIPGGTAEITGGTYPADPTLVEKDTKPVLAPNMEVVENENGEFVVGYDSKYVAIVGDKAFETLEEALEYAADLSGDVEVELLRDVELSENWTSVDLRKPDSFVLEGNGHTISGLTAPIFGKVYVDLTINGVNVTDSDIKADGKEGSEESAAGALIGWYEAHSDNVLSINGCNVSDSTIEGTGWTGGLVGYISTTGKAVIEDCSVENCEITGGSSTGAVVGHANSVEIKDVTVSGNTLECTDENGTRPDKVGIVVGRVNGGSAEISATVANDNEVIPAGTNDQRIIGSLPGATTEITGGTYPADPTLIEGDGTKPTVSEDLKFAVNPDGSVTVGDHVHDWSADWTVDETAHWHKCDEDECFITEKEDMLGYSKHTCAWAIAIYPTSFNDGLAVYACVTCGYAAQKVVIPAQTPSVPTEYTVNVTANDGGTVVYTKTVAAGEDTTIVITPNEGYEIASVSVNGVSYGTVNEITVEDVKSDLNVVVSFAELPWENPFTDIFEEDEYYDAVEFVYENGLFLGTSETEFSPEMTMTRAMFVTVLGRLAGVDTSLYTDVTFGDVVAGEWYAPYVAWASENGIVNGYDTGDFGVEDEITVEQAIVILYRYASFIGADGKSDVTLGYEDADEISSWALEAMTWAVANGIYVGEDGSLDPQAPASRALVAELVYVFANNFAQ